MFTGASQFALVGIVGTGGSVWAGAATAALLGSRNALYGLRLSSILDRSGPRRLLATHFVPDPKVFGLDAAPPAAFLALLAPRLRAREPMAIALAAGVVALVCLPFVPAGIPLLIVAVLVAIYGLLRTRP